MAGPSGQPEGVAEDVRLLGRQNPAEAGFPPASVASRRTRSVFARQPIPYGKQQAGDQPQAGFSVAGQTFDLRIPQRGPAIFAGILPVRGGKFLRGHGLAGGGTDQADPGLDPAVLEHPRRRGQNHGGALRAGVDDGPPVAQGERIFSRQRHEPVAADDLDKLGGGARGFMNVNRLARGHGE